jgi:hypothetical protein
MMTVTKKTKASIMKSATLSATTAQHSIESLPSLATGHFLIRTEQEIGEKAKATVADRRASLHRQLAELDEEVERDVEKRVQALDKLRNQALEQFANVVGAPGDAYCLNCMSFYQTVEKNLCRIAGCNSHKLCPVCVNPENDDDFPVDTGDFLESGEYPSSTRYLDCWICTSNATFCNRHFVDHYPTCRYNASRRCGFRPPTE